MVNKVAEALRSDEVMRWGKEEAIRKERGEKRGRWVTQKGHEKEQGGGF